MNDDRFTALEERVRTVEMAVVELATMAKYLRVLVVIVGASLGVQMEGLL